MGRNARYSGGTGRKVGSKLEKFIFQGKSGAIVPILIWNVRRPLFTHS